MNNQVTKCIIIVGGYGTRFLPITKSISKTMLPIIDKPSIQYIVEEAIASGIKEIVIIVNRKDSIITTYFEKNKKLEELVKDTPKIKYLEQINDLVKGIRISYVFEETSTGSASAVLLARKYIKHEPFAVLFGDDLYMSDTPALKQLIDIHDKTNGNVLGVKEVLEQEIPSYGIVAHDNYRVSKLVEKPTIKEAPSNLAVVGRYILNYTIFDIIDNLAPGINNEYQLTDAIIESMKTESLYACPIVGQSFDTGSKAGYVKANIAFALTRDDLKSEIKSYIDNLTK